jgi:cold shock CspA family protein
MNKENIVLGIIKWYSSEKGFGVISKINSNEEIFLHFSNWIDTDTIISSDTQILIFNISFERNKKIAKSCRYFQNSLEDCEVFIKLSYELNHYLYAYNQHNSEIKLINLLNTEYSKNFQKILEKNFLSIENHDFIDTVEKNYKLFDKSFIIQAFVFNESVKRFNQSNNIEFKKNLLMSHNIKLEDIEFNSLLKSFRLNKNIIKLIKKHPSFIENINLVLERVKKSSFFNEIFFIAIENNSKKIDTYMDYFIHNLSEADIIDMYYNLLKLCSINKFKYNIKEKFEKYILNKKNKKLIVQAYKANILHIDYHLLVNEYIDVIDLALFLKIKEEYQFTINDIKNIFYNNNEKLLKYLIINFEDFTIDNYQVFFDIGTERLFYFSTENQILYIRKLFHLKYLKLLNFEKTNLSSFINDNIIYIAKNNDLNMDFSTYLIIDLILKFDETDGFMATHEIIKSVLRLIELKPKEKVQIGIFFDKCDGIAYKTAYSNKIITIEQFTTRQGNINYFLKIEFPYNEDIVNSIKEFQIRKYYPEEQYWGVSIKYIDEVIEFGKRYDFLFKLGNNYNYYELNSHLINIVKKENQKPIGIEYCCGQEAQAEENFWWCNQTQCFKNNIKEHSNWQEYTLFDFMKILGLSLKEDSKDGGFIYQIGLYTRFVTFLNRFNHLLEKMYCNECGHVLYPVETSNFHKFSVTKFICKNEVCSSKEEVYLNNCLNGQCNEIIDSRESEQCTNNWYICHKCGSCCSHIALERRLKNLNTNGGKIYEGLKKLIIEKAGHLEKAEYFCYRCGQLMIEYSDTLYKCKDCNIKYDLEPYKNLLKKRTHINYRVSNYPNKSDIISQELKRILLEEKNNLIENGRNKKQIFGILFNKEVEIDGEIISLKEIHNKKLVNEIFN